MKFRSGARASCMVIVMLHVACVQVDLLFGGQDIDDSVQAKNVLFIAVDDMRDWVTCLNGYEGVVHTPNIDRLANQGVLFTNAHCPSPKCAPSRAAILTGKMPSTTGLYENLHWWLPNYPDAITLPNYFRQHGYWVAGAGKIFHHTAGNHPPNQWDEFQRLTFQNDPWFRGVELNYPWSNPIPFPDDYPYSGLTNLGHEHDWGSLPIDSSEYEDSISVDFVVERLSRHHDQPFFLACGLFRPHLPWYVPQAFFDLYAIDEIELPPLIDNDLSDVPTIGRQFAEARANEFEHIRDSGYYHRAIQAYLASISYADHQVGRLLDALESSPYADQTIVVFWSDHGWHLGEKEHWHKSTLWEEATRVPFIIAGPDIEPGRCSRPVSLIHLFPTLIELCELPRLNDLDGVSLELLLHSPSREWNRPAIIEFRRGNAAVRSEQFRLIRYSDGTEELYDHQNDPNEWNNLIESSEFADVRRELTHWLPTDWAGEAKTKNAFRFDPHSFEWTDKQTGEVVSGRHQNN